MIGTLAVVQPAVPERTTLVGIDPICVGTSRVEGLPGYIARLAWEHRLTPATMFRAVAAAGLADPAVPGLDQAAWTRHLDAGLRDSSLGLLGRDRTSATAVQAFEQLTGRSDLTALTLLGLSPVLPSLGLVKTARQFCSECLDEWESKGLPVYEPLLWALRPVTVCLDHDAWLQTACPSCGAERWPLTATAAPGRCVCGAWLGDAAPRPIDPADIGAEWDRWATGELGAVIAETGTIEVNALAIADAVALAIVVATNGNMTAFAELVGTALSTVSLWRSGRRMPSVGSSLRICRVTGWRLVDFLGGRLEVLSVEARTGAGSVRGERRPYRRIDWASIEPKVVAALDELPPPSLLTLGNRLGLKDRALKRRYPTLAAKVVARYEARRHAEAVTRLANAVRLVTDTVGAIHAGGRYPSEHQVRMALPSSVSMRDPRVGEAWRSSVIALGYRNPAASHPERGYGHVTRLAGRPHIEPD